MKISNDGYTTDADRFVALDKNLGAKFKWNPGPTIDGETLHCESNRLFLIEPILQTQAQVNGNKF